MTKVFVGKKELEIVIFESAIEKAQQLNVTEETIKELIENNPESVEEARENEDILLVGNPTITFFLTSEKVIVTNFYGKEKVY